MAGRELATKINEEIAEAGYRQEIFAVGPSGIPILLKSLILQDGSISIPPGFRIVVSLVSNNNDQLSSIGNISNNKQSTGNGADIERHQALLDQSE